MMSNWDHSICEACWRLREGVNRLPDRAISGTPHSCCFCGLPTNGGIFVRQEPNSPNLRCSGVEGHHEELAVEDGEAR